MGRLGRFLTRAAAPEDERLHLLRTLAVDVVVDVGANEGLYAAGLRARGYRGRIVSIEPFSEAFAKLERATAGDARWECLRAAVGAASGEATLNVAANWASSSLLPMDERLPRIEPRTEYVGTERCMVVTLDELRTRLLSPGERAFLKLDVQGFELEVLRGAEETLRQVDALDVELSLVPLYEGAPAAAEIVRHLEARGFSARSREPAFRDPETGDVLQVDALFARESS